MSASRGKGGRGLGRRTRQAPRPAGRQARGRGQALAAHGRQPIRGEANAQGAHHSELPGPPECRARPPVEARRFTVCERGECSARRRRAGVSQARASAVQPLHASLAPPRQSVSKSGPRKIEQSWRAGGRAGAQPRGIPLPTFLARVQGSKNWDSNRRPSRFILGSEGGSGSRSDVLAAQSEMERVRLSLQHWNS